MLSKFLYWLGKLFRCKVYYVVYGNYFPEEFVTGFFTSNKLAEEVCDYLCETTDFTMYETREQSFGGPLWDSLNVWKIDWEK